MNNEMIWKDRGTVYRRTKEKGKELIEGRLNVNNATFVFSLREQNGGSYTHRGRVGILDRTGKPLKRKKSGSVAGASGVERESLTTSFYCNSDAGELTDETVKECIMKSVNRLMKDNQGLITDEVKGSYTPDTITLQIAGSVFVMEYVLTEHPGAGEELKDNLATKLKNICFRFPCKYMCDVTEADVHNFFNREKTGKTAKNELRKFWDFMLERGICSGTNPVPEYKYKKRNPVTEQKGAMKMVEMDVSQFDKFCEKFEKKEKLNGADAGVLLMLSGFPSRYIVMLVWKDITFKKESDYVIVRNVQENRAGATHDFSRPVLPQTALALRRLFRDLKEKYGEEIMTYPIAATSADPMKALTPEALNQEATRTLRGTVSKNYTLKRLHKEDRSTAASSRILAETYKRIILDRCNLERDPGTSNFLLGRSLGNDITSDAYTSFTSEDASRRLYNILRTVRKTENHRKTVSEKKENGRLITELFPKTSREYVNMISDIVLMPGESIVISCEHGVEGNYRTENYVSK